MQGTPATNTENAKPIDFSDLEFSRDLSDTSPSIEIAIPASSAGNDGGSITIGYSLDDEINADRLRFDANGDGNDLIDELNGDSADKLFIQGIGTNDLAGFYRYNLATDSIDSDGNGLRIVFNDDIYITLLNSFYSDNVGVDEIHFDTNSDGVKDTGEEIWYYDAFSTYLT